MSSNMISYANLPPPSSLICITRHHVIGEHVCKQVHQNRSSIKIAIIWIIDKGCTGVGCLYMLWPNIDIAK